MLKIIYTGERANDYFGVHLSKLQPFFKRYKTTTFKKGEVILGQDVDPHCAHVIKKGVVKTYNLTAKGEEKPIGFNVAGKVFPLGWVFDKISKSQYFYEALDDVELYVVPKDELIDFIRSNSDAMFELLDRFAWEVIVHEMHINALEQLKASDKVIQTLHYLALCFGHDLRKDVVKIPIPITQQDIANMTGLTRETTNLELKRLVAQKVISSKKRNYVVLTDKLNDYLDDEYEHRLIR